MENKTIVITGISSGIGESIAEEILTRLPNAFIIGLGRRSSDKLDGHKRYHFMELDLSNLSQIKPVFRAIKQKYGEINLLINNAGFGYKGTIEDTSVEEATHQFNVNFIATLMCIKEVLPQMRKKQAGHIINISALGSLLSTPTLGIYGCTKSALNKLSEVLFEEVKKYNIKVSIVYPGAVKTKFGKNIINVSAMEKGAYGDLYSSWDKRFRNFFKRALSQEEAGKRIVELIEKPRLHYFLTNRDKVIYLLVRVLPYSLNNKILTKFFFKP